MYRDEVDVLLMNCSAGRPVFRWWFGDAGRCRRHVQASRSTETCRIRYVFDFRAVSETMPCRKILEHQQMKLMIFDSCFCVCLGFRLRPDSRRIHPTLHPRLALGVLGPTYPRRRCCIAASCMSRDSQCRLDEAHRQPTTKDWREGHHCRGSKGRPHR